MNLHRKSGVPLVSRHLLCPPYLLWDLNVDCCSVLVLMIQSSLWQVPWTSKTLLGLKFQMEFKWTSVGVSQPPNPHQAGYSEVFLNPAALWRQTDRWACGVIDFTAPVLIPKPEHLALDSVSHCPWLGLSLQREWITLQYLSLTLRANSLCKTQTLWINQIFFSVTSASCPGYVISRFGKSMALALLLLFF